MAKMPDEFEGKSTAPGKGGAFAFVAAQADKSGARDPQAVAAAAGRKKYGADKFQKMAEAGKNATQPLAWEGIKAKGK